MFKRFLIFVSLLMFLIGCSSNESGAENTGSTEIESFTFALPLDTQAIEPFNGTSTTSATVIYQMFNALTRTSPEGEVQGDLAESFERVDDLTWQFTLHENVTFHNGEEFNAETVKFSVERMLDTSKQFGLTSDYLFIDRVEIIDDYTVNIITKEPNNGTPLSLIYLSMVPKEYIEENGDEYFAENPVGTGPFTFQEYAKDTHVKYERYDDYFKGKVNVKELTFKPIPEESSRIAALESGEVDLIADVSINQLNRLEQTENLAVESFPTTRVSYIGFNMRKDSELIQNESFRKALNHAVNVDSIIDNLLEGNGETIPAIFLDHFNGYDSGVEPYAYDVDKAKELLDEAGYNGERLELAIDANSKQLPVAEAVADMIREIGVDIEVVQKENVLMREEVAAGTISDLYLFNIGGAYNSSELISRIGFGSEQRYSTFFNSEMDELRMAANSEMDEAQSEELWQEYQDEIYDIAPAIFLYQEYASNVLSDVYTNYTPRRDELILLEDIEKNE
ncbi:ABC transporter substrate-binding protein [Oceanobacillus oncorhynchi]|uniref:ABC transporter substrate-binding protein n=1 Tax=Oceanobacillus oncorhynchi TaxID=545501 RepID=UPI001867E12B|nr:ABC transporter substrate-binding protein [Oceanobacillus oncorhynchi]